MQSRRTQALSALVAIFSLVCASRASAETATVGPVKLDIPAGFQSAAAETRGPARMAGWVKGDATTKTLLQITIFDGGSDFPGTPAENALTQAADKSLGEFLKGIERRRTDYSQTPFEHLTLAGLPAARSTWKGHVGDIDMVGVMYAVVVNNRLVVTLHTQDVGTAISPAMREAMQAFEGMRLVK
jgi:hypothetical protein